MTTASSANPLYQEWMDVNKCDFNTLVTVHLPKLLESTDDERRNVGIEIFNSFGTANAIDVLKALGNYSDTARSALGDTLKTYVDERVPGNIVEIFQDETMPAWTQLEAAKRLGNTDVQLRLCHWIKSYDSIYCNRYLDLFSVCMFGKHRTPEVRLEGWRQFHREGMIEILNESRPKPKFGIEFPAELLGREYYPSEYRLEGGIYDVFMRIAFTLFITGFEKKIQLAAIDLLVQEGLLPKDNNSLKSIFSATLKSRFDGVRNAGFNLLGHETVIQNLNHAFYWYDPFVEARKEFPLGALNMLERPECAYKLTPEQLYGVLKNSIGEPNMEKLSPIQSAAIKLLGTDHVKGYLKPEDLGSLNERVTAANETRALRDKLRRLAGPVA